MNEDEGATSVRTINKVIIRVDEKFEIRQKLSQEPGFRTFGKTIWFSVRVLQKKKKCKNGSVSSS